MLSTCTALRCSPARVQAAAGPSQQKQKQRPQRRAVWTAATPPQQQQQQQASKQAAAAPPPPAQAANPADQPDFWEGEQWEGLGKIASAAIPILAAAAVGVGIFASQTYNEGATMFLDTPKGPEDTAKLIPAQQPQPPQL